MPSSIINRSKKFRNKPAADKKCHKSCLSNIPIVHGLFMSLDNAGETFVVFSLDINSIIAYTTLCYTIQVILGFLKKF